MTEWIKLLPNAPEDAKTKCKEIAERRIELERQVQASHREEADLYMSLYHSGKYTHEQMNTAFLQGMCFKTVYCLPQRLPPMKKKKK